MLSHLDFYFSSPLSQKPNHSFLDRLGILHSFFNPSPLFTVVDIFIGFVPLLTLGSVPFTAVVFMA